MTSNTALPPACVPWAIAPADRSAHFELLTGVRAFLDAELPLMATATVRRGFSPPRFAVRTVRMSMSCDAANARVTVGECASCRMLGRP